MKRYLLFAGEIYDTSGGMDDFICDWDNFESLKDHVRWQSGKPFSEKLEITSDVGLILRTIESPSGQWYHIYDSEKQKIVFRDYSGNPNHHDGYEP